MKQYDTKYSEGAGPVDSGLTKVTMSTVSSVSQKFYDKSF